MLWSWVRRDIAWIAEQQELSDTDKAAVVIAPFDETGFSMWADPASGPGIAHEVTETLSAYVESEYNVLRGRENTHIQGFSMFLAGGGIRGGVTIGATDELGYHAVEEVVHVRDLHATMLHLLGVDHERLAVRHQGLDVKLTGVERARIVSGLVG